MEKSARREQRPKIFLSLTLHLAARRKNLASRMSKSVLGRGLGSLLGSADNKNQSDASPKGVGLLLRGSTPSTGVAPETPDNPVVTPPAPAPAQAVPQVQVPAPERAGEMRQKAVAAPPISASRPAIVSPPAPAVAIEPAKPAEIWRNPVVWLVAADVVFVALAGWIAVAGHSPLRWLGVSLLMLMAGSVGFVGYFFPSLGSTPTPVPEPKDKPKIRVHFVDELPKRRS